MSKNLNLSTIIDQHNHKPQFVILDIDSTLVTTYQRNQAIIEDFCKAVSSDYPEETRLLKKAKCQLGDYGYHTSLNRLEKKPEDPVFMAELQNFWRKNFFSNNYLHADVPAKGAVEYVNKLVESNIPMAYLTGRYKDAMWEGTLSSLSKLGFPISENILILKENPKEADEVYKSKAVTQLKNQYSGHQVWLIDNEPMILHEIVKDHPDVQLIWFDSCHSGKKQPPEAIPSITHFDL